MSNRMRYQNKSVLNPNFDHFFGDHEDFNVDIRETDEAYIVEADLPGLDKVNIELDYFSNVLSIRTHQEERKDEGNYIRRERSSRSYSRQFLIKNVVKEAIRARFKKGVLTINMPKKYREKDERKGIKIESI